MAPDLDLETLRLLVVVSEVGSLSRAASQRGISQPAASARIKAFEARWRLGVLQRTTRGSILTTDGEAVVSWARTVLHAADTMQASLVALSGQPRAGLSLAASLTVAEHILPRWLGELHVRQPSVSPTLSVINSEQVIEAVRAATVDIGFIESAWTPPDLSHVVVGHDRLAVVVSPDHPWARRSTPIRAEELARARWVLREPGSGTRATFEAALRREPLVALAGTSTTALIGAAMSDIGPAVVSALSARAEIETGRLRVVETELDLLRPLSAVWLPHTRLSDPATELLRIATSGSGGTGASRRK